MRLALALALAIAAPAAARDAAPKAAPGKPDCRAPAAQHVRSVGVRPLNREPDAKLIRAVDYREGGCPKLVVIGATRKPR